MRNLVKEDQARVKEEMSFTKLVSEYLLHEGYLFGVETLGGGMESKPSKKYAPELLRKDSIWVFSGVKPSTFKLPFYVFSGSLKHPRSYPLGKLCYGDRRKGSKNNWILEMYDYSSRKRWGNFYQEFAQDIEKISGSFGADLKSRIVKHPYLPYVGGD
ncbi:hypothetical protein HOD29_00910 [archaeon]|jgi:hypothetical protein|nr:hypothetical protein [archaeon]